MTKCEAVLIPSDWLRTGAVVELTTENLGRALRALSQAVEEREASREYAIHLKAILMRCRDGMEQVCDHATDSVTNETGIPYAFKVGEQVGERESVVYVPLNELDGIRMSLAEIAFLSNSPAASGPLVIPGWGERTTGVCETVAVKMAKDILGAENAVRDRKEEA